jgi:hypothetical protein
MSYKCSRGEAVQVEVGSRGQPNKGARPRVFQPEVHLSGRNRGESLRHEIKESCKEAGLQVSVWFYISLFHGVVVEARKLLLVSSRVEGHDTETEIRQSDSAACV